MNDTEALTRERRAALAGSECLSAREVLSREGLRLGLGLVLILVGVELRLRAVIELGERFDVGQSAAAVSLRVRNICSMKAGMSPGWREVIKLRSITTSSSV